ncbi:cytochrome P450 [Pleurotus eryngii]|uniref:Cytochrome P450 n=1 Tax=Pleurotus eryngii TaxID=5323 RepID=A0A9P5ZX54_PLEER|nr:cytochrome P450 [Pleurotus eryngii]
MLPDIALLVSALLLPLAAYYWWHMPRLPLPPGPKGYPIVGNLLDLPSKQQWVKFLEWSKESVVKWGSQSYHHSNCSKAWFNPSQATNHRPKQLWYSRCLLRRLLKEPANFPGFKRFAEKARPDTIEILSAPFHEGCRHINFQQQKSQPSLLSRSLANGGHSVQDHPDTEFIKEVAAVAYSGGAETTKSALSNFIAAMLLYPEVQKNGQKELDSYSQSRLPSFEDLPHMSYVQAIMLEVASYIPLQRNSSETRGSYTNEVLAHKTCAVNIYMVLVARPAPTATRSTLGQRLNWLLMYSVRVEASFYIKYLLLKRYLPNACRDSVTRSPEEELRSLEAEKLIRDSG